MTRLYILFLSLISVTYLACSSNHTESTSDNTVRDTTKKTTDTPPRIHHFQHFETGQIINYIKCVQDSSESFCLYLPKDYDTTKNWPVIYFFDAHARGKLPLKKYSELAEKYNEIFIGSNNSQNGLQPNAYDKIVNDLFSTTLTVLNIDEKRITVAGFSGGAKVAGAVAIINGDITSVIGCGAPMDARRLGSAYFNYVGIAGKGDFNYWEMTDLDNYLSQTPLKHQLLTFDGIHEWPDKSTFSKAILFTRQISNKEATGNSDKIDPSLREKEQQYISGKWITRKIAKVTDTVFNDTGLICVKRTYRILAYQNSTNSTTLSDSIFGTPIDTVPPNSPAFVNVTYDPGSTGQIDISFKTVGNNDLAGYKLYSWNNDTLGTIPSSLTFLSNPNTLSSTISPTSVKHYCYDEVAVDSCGNLSKIQKHCAIELLGKALNLSALLNWTSDNETGLIKYYIERKTTGTFATVDSAVKGDTNVTETNLACNVTYTYRIRASFPGNINSYSNTLVVTPYDTVKPQQVNIEDVTVLSNTVNQITFDKVADPVVTQYAIYARKDNGSFSLLTTITKPTTNPIIYKHTGINTQADSFAYRVYAIDSCNSNTSATSQTHSPVLLAGVAGDYAAGLGWKFYTGFPVKGYYVEYLSGGTWKTLSALLSATTNHYIDQPIPCIKKDYRIRVVPATGSVVSVSDSVEILPFDTVKPAAPVITYATVTGFNAITLNWTKSTSNDVRRYDVYRKLSTASTFSFLKQLGDVNTYIDTKVNTDSGVSYCYEVVAVDSCAQNNSPFSAPHCIMNLKADSNICYQKLFVSWSAYSGWTTGISKFLLYRKVQSTGADTLIATLPNTAVSYVDSIISNKRNYCYKIVAVPNTGAFTSSSNYSCSKIYQIVVPQIYSASKISTSLTTGTVVVKWKSVSGLRFYKYYQLYYKPQTGSTFTLLQNNIPITTDSFVHNNINTKTLDHDYYLVIVDSCGNKTAPSPIHQTMIVTITIGQLRHNISWTPYGGFNIKYYILQRFQNSAYVDIDTVPSTKTKDLVFPAPCNFHIYYRIMAVDSFGHYAWSDTMGKQAIDTIPSNAPTFTNATVLDYKTVQLNFFGADSATTYSYAIQRKTNGTWSTAGTVLFTTKHAAMQFIDNVSTLKDEHCYTIITLDSCLNATPSDTFCTITLTGKGLEGANKLTWNKFKGYNIKTYTVDILKGNNWVPLAILPNIDTVLIHDSLHCTVPQYYKILGIESGGGRITYSDSIKVTPYDTVNPSATVLQYASVIPNGTVKLLWTYNVHSAVKYFEIWRKVNSNPYKLIDSVKFDSTYIDKNGINPSKDTISYYIISVDSCFSSLKSVASDTARLMNFSISTSGCVPLNQISWTAYNHFPGGTDNFTIYRSTGFSPFVKLKSVSANVHTYNDYAVVVGTKYTYIIQAHTPTTNLSSFTDTFSIVPHLTNLPNTANIIYTSVVNSGLASGSIYIQWARDPLNDSVAIGYHLYEADPATNSYKLILDTTNLADTSFTQTGINTLTGLHEYKLGIYNKCPDDGAPGNIHQPVNLQVKNYHNLRAALTWTGYKGAIVKGYDVYRSDNRGTSRIITSTPPGDTTYLDTNLVCEHLYVYEIHTRLGSNLTSESDSVGITGSDTILPPKANLYVISTDTTLITGGKIGMRWFGNTKISREGYNIYRQVNGGAFSLYFKLYTIKVDTLYWQDQFCNTVDSTYAYYITSFDSCGNESLPANTDRSVVIKAKSYSRYMHISWTPYIGFKNWTYVLEKRKLNSSWQPLTSFNNSTLSYSDSDVNCHVFYYYRIRYVDANSRLFGFSNQSGDTAYDTVPPKISQIVRATVIQTGTTNGKVQIDWDASTSKDVQGYYVYRSLDNFNWENVSNMISGLTYNDTNLNTYHLPYYYRITPIDTCGNLGIGYSNTHKTINLKVAPGNQQIALKWNHYEGWTVKSYNIWRDGKLFANVGKDSSTYIDTLTTCIYVYHYKIEAVSDSGIAISAFSNEDSARPVDHVAPHKVYLRSASIDVNAGQVVVTWDSSSSFDVKTYNVYRKIERTGDMVFVGSTTKTIIYEDLNNIKSADCYYVFAQDFCGNISSGSNRGCLIILQGLNQKDQNLLNWNSYGDWPDGIKSYSIYKDEDNAGWNQIGSTPGSNLSFVDGNLTNDVIDYCYQVEAIENEGIYNATSKSTIVCLHHDPDVYVPNAFTPHTSFGINDSFGPKGMFIKSYHMDIYNRWGENIYHTDNSGKWDGTFQGALALPDVYIYYIRVEGYNAGEYRYKGNLMILY